MAEDRDTEARWYVVHTDSGYEPAPAGAYP